MRWRYWARIVLALGALAVTVAVVVALKRHETPAPAAAIVRTDPKAIVESTGGRVVRFNRGHEDISVEYERQLTYKDGSTRLVGVRVSADDRGDGRRFIVTGDEGQMSKDESAVALAGHVKLVEGDGFTVETDSATYSDVDSTVRAPGAVTFHQNRLSGSGIGLVYEKNTDVLTIPRNADVRVAADASGNGAAHVTSGSTRFARLKKQVRFDDNVRVVRGGQTISAPAAVVQLSMDEKRIETLVLEGRSRIEASTNTDGGLRSVGGKDVLLTYAADSEALKRVDIGGNSDVRLSGGAKAGDRKITSNTFDLMLAPDGQTPVMLHAKERVELTMPSDDGQAARTVRSAALVAWGQPTDPTRGLTEASFSGGVEYREKSATVERTARSVKLDVVLKNGMSGFESASFLGAANFVDQRITGNASTVRYDVDKGSLELGGSEPGSVRPHVFNDQIAVDANTVNVVLAGPVLNAKGSVKSVLQPPKKSDGGDGTRLPSMLKQDEPVIIMGDVLDYDSSSSQATYKGNAQLWQGDTSIKANSIGIDDKSGNLTADGSVVTTTTTTEQTDKDKKKERVRSTATAGSFAYDEATRHAAYRKGVHLTGGQGDLTADSIDLYLKMSGNEIERAEASDPKGGLVLREQGRKTTGHRLRYTSADDRYEVTGTPVTLTDSCGRVTTGRTLTFRKETDTIEIDGNQRVRTQTTNGEKCQVTAR